MKPSQGRIVIYTQGANEAAYNGILTHPAIVTRVWGTDETPLINLTVFPDVSAPKLHSSVAHKSKAQPGQGHWDWPERVPA